MEIWQTTDDLVRVLTNRWHIINDIYFNSELDIKKAMSKEDLTRFLRHAFYMQEESFYGGEEAIWYRTDIGLTEEHFDIISGMKTEPLVRYMPPFNIDSLKVNNRLSASLGRCSSEREITIGYKGYIQYGNLHVLDSLYHEMAHLAGYWNHDKAFWKEGKRTGFGKFVIYPK